MSRHIGRERRLPGHLADFVLEESPSFSDAGGFGTPASVAVGGYVSDENPVRMEPDKAKGLTSTPVGRIDVEELNRTIQKLELQNKLIEKDLLEKRNDFLKQQSQPGGGNSKTGQQSVPSRPQSKILSSAVGDRRSVGVPTLAALQRDSELVERATATRGHIVGVNDIDFLCSNTNYDNGECLLSRSEGNLQSSYTLFYNPDIQNKKAVSGEARAAKDRVKFDVPWPHEYGQTKSVGYSDFDFNFTQLVRGEIFILHNVEKNSMNSGSRMRHLINLLYLVEKFPFLEIKDFHAEVL
ncbi:hypothetical protein SNE40_017173 [Patella caerulea]|uniref:Uncharacterized protein n=1 Tax=Patella caerulea TaxID=87958 RepID=A0AAN8PF85_PATCE